MELAEAPDRKGDRSKCGPFTGSNEAPCRHQRRVPGAAAVVRRCAPKHWYPTRAVTPA
jgi:hypothetical protein